MSHFYTEFKDPNASNVTDHINQRIIVNSVGVAKPMRRQTHYVWKQSEVNHIHTHSNVPIVKTTTKQTSICVCSKGTGSTANSIRRNTLRSMKTGQSQFVLSGIVTHNDLWQLKNFFSEYPQKFSDCQYYPRGLVILQHNLLSRTPMVNYSYNSKLY